MKIKSIALLVVITFSACTSSPENEWVNLIKNDSLEGWRVLGGEGSYEVIDGEVVGTTKGTANTFLATKSTYDDFILELEVYVDPRMNSGIQFRSAQNEQGTVFGYQAEIDPSDRKWSGGLYDESRRGWLYPLDLNEQAKSAFKNNTWNKYRIEAVGDLIRIWVNGSCTTAVKDSVSSAGFIALQVHGVGTEEEEGRQVKWRNVRLTTNNLVDSQRPVPDSVIQLYLLENTELEDK